MKHDLEAFSREIVSLIKTSGDTGGSGDKSKKTSAAQRFLCPHSTSSDVPTGIGLGTRRFSDWGQQKFTF